MEPEILIDGSHSMERSQEVAEAVISAVIEKLQAKGVDLKACLLKIQMVMPGSEAEKAASQDIARATLAVLSR